MLFAQDMIGELMIKSLVKSHRVLRPLLRQIKDDFLEKCRQDIALRRRLLKIMWSGFIVGMIIITIICVLVSQACTSSYRIGTFTATVIWAIFLGVTALLFLQRTMITTIFGFMIGSGVSEASSGAGIITSVNKSVIKISSQISTAVVDNPTDHETFVAGLVWTFIIIFTLLCLPALFAGKPTKEIESVKLSERDAQAANS